MCLFKSIMPIWCYLWWAQFKSGFTPKFGVIFGVHQNLQRTFSVISGVTPET